MSTLLFRDAPQLDEASLRAAAGAAGLDQPIFNACFAGAAAEKVQEDETSARHLGATGTPAFILGTRVAGTPLRMKALQRVVGSSLAQIEQAVDKMLASLSPAAAGGQ